MVEPSKILTVSYGTFSCTLEGFDDSFGTMKAIAEYFRDLAADDRYFGAEPPTPDVAMLAKIAEREITRRVDAHTTDGGIVLRASEAVAPAMPPQVERPDPVQVAAAAVAPRMASTPTDHTLDDFQTALSDATADDMEPVAGPEAEDHVSSPLVASGQAAPSGLTLDDMAPAAKGEAPAHPDSESVAAKLQRIRAVVGKAAPKVEDPDFAEDLADPEMPAIADVEEDLVADAVKAEDIVAEDVFEPEFEAEAEDAIEAQDMDDAVEDIAAPEIAKETSSQSLVADLMADADDAQEDLAEISLGDDQLAEDIADAQDTFDADVDEAIAQEPSDLDDEDAMLSNLQAKVAQSVAAPKVEEAPAADAKPIIRAQVLRLRKTEAEATAKEDAFLFNSDAADDEDFDDAYELDEDFDDFDDMEDDADRDLADVAALDGADDMDDFAAPVHTSLSEEDEADLMEELAELERDTADVPAPAAQKPRHSLPETDDATMSHILNQVDQEMSEPEGNRRRNAIAQLKAAVAATEAARQLGDKGDTTQKTEEAFRGDLDEVVRPSRPATPTRPTRPEASATRTERPRPTPLKLVASQRVDAQASETAAPVAPRRVATAATEVSAAAASNFAEFAENMGATSLADLLEAAAAYTAFVEGVEDFSRPQIMKKVQLTSETEISREDGLRSFGTLLRQGRISKVRNGRFQVSEETRFRPESKVG